MKILGRRVIYEKLMATSAASVINNYVSRSERKDGMARIGALQRVDLAGHGAQSAMLTH